MNAAARAAVTGKVMRCRIRTPLRRDLLIIGNGREIVGSKFVPLARRGESKPSDALLAEAVGQARAYFERRLVLFDLPLALDGSDFQIAVWRAVAALAFGNLFRTGTLLAPWASRWRTAALRPRWRSRRSTSSFRRIG